MITRSKISKYFNECQKTGERLSFFGLASYLKITSAELLSIKNEISLPQKMQKNPRVTREVNLAFDRICTALETNADGRGTTLCIAALKQYGGYGASSDSDIVTDIDAELGA